MQFKTLIAALVLASGVASLPAANPQIGAIESALSPVFGNPSASDNSASADGNSAKDSGNGSLNPGSSNSVGNAFGQGAGAGAGSGAGAGAGSNNGNPGSGNKDNGNNNSIGNIGSIGKD